jgi:hypothetical protein
MCDPISLGIAAVSLGVAGLGTSVYGAVSQGEAQKEQGDAQRRAMEANAAAQRESARSAQNVGAVQAAEQKQKTRQLISQQVVAGAASGINPLTGTAGQLSEETAQMGELDALRIMNNAQRQAWGYQTQASIDEFSGSQAAAAGGRAQTAGYIGAGGSLLSGLGNIGMTAAKFGGSSTKPKVKPIEGGWA